MKSEKNNLLISYSIFVFTFLFSGNVIYSPFYDTENAVASFILTSIIVLAYTAFTGKFFSKRVCIQRKNAGGFFAFAILLTMVVPIGSLVCDYVKTLGTFADYYAKAFTVCFAAFSVIFCAVYGANKGRICVIGFATLIFPLLAVWTVAGLLAFFTTKNVVFPDMPFANITKIQWLDFVKNAAYVCLDITFAAVVLSNNQSEQTRKIIPHSMNSGAFAYVIFGGINLLKNILLFGSDFAKHINNPDLAAIRLIPMFDLPEISVMVNTLACVMKLSVYCCFIMFVLKDALTGRYSAAKSSTFLFAGGAVLFGVFYFVAKIMTSVNLLAMICLTFSVLICYVFFSVPANRQKNIK